MIKDKTTLRRMATYCRENLRDMETCLKADDLQGAARWAVDAAGAAGTCEAMLGDQLKEADANNG